MYKLIKTKALLYIVILFLAFSLLVPAPALAQAVDADDINSAYTGLVWSPDGLSFACSSGNFAGGNNAEIVWNYLISKGFSEEQTAGFLGNFQVESGFDPTVINEIGAIGLAQWLGGRKDGLFAFAEGISSDPLTLETQLQYVWFELRGEPVVPGVPGGGEAGAYTRIVGTTTVEEAATVVEDAYERSGGALVPQRVNAAIEAFANFSGTATPGTGSSSCGGLGISPEGFVFPLRTTKSALAAGSSNGNTTLIWCEDSLVSCHGHYPAADIFVQEGTQVVAAQPGIVTRVRNGLGGLGSNVHIYNAEDDVIYYYTHMAYNSVIVNAGQTIEAGNPLGLVGDKNQADGTPPHLHFDITKPFDGDRTRFTCKRITDGRTPACSPTYDGYFIDPQPFLVEAYQSLPN